MTAPRRRTRALGQHFLRDLAVARAIAEAAAPAPADVVLEIGAGEGVLTRLLAASAGKVIALEVDPALYRRLLSEAEQLPALDLRLADARRFDYASLPGLRPSAEGRVLVVGNLPYSLSKPILLCLFEARAALDELTLMLQREVAERLTAPPGRKAYGLLSVLWQAWAELRLLFHVPPGAFRPRPKVDSSVLQIRFLPRPRIPIADEAAFVRLVKAAFAQRRKTLANALAAAYPYLGRAGAQRACAGAGINPGRRGESLGLGEFARLAEILGQTPGVVR